MKSCWLIDLNRYDIRWLNYGNNLYLSGITVVLTLLAFLLRRSVPQRKNDLLKIGFGKCI